MNSILNFFAGYLTDQEYIEEGKRRCKFFQECQANDSVWLKRNFKKESMDGFFLDIGKIPTSVWNAYIKAEWTKKHLEDLYNSSDNKTC